uniref:Uncharacterized protein n=1 Tax=Myotis myotis TaxID=51298 RepID=A0A7J8ALZ5_MYOMY|nr:hypothetical protein mMyoMyo1_007900 [Myotis myotis]
MPFGSQVFCSKVQQSYILKPSNHNNQNDQRAEPPQPLSGLAPHPSKWLGTIRQAGRVIRGDQVGRQVVRGNQVGRRVVRGDQVGRPEVSGNEAGRQSPTINCLKEGDPGHSLQEGRSAAVTTGGTGSGEHYRVGLASRRLLSKHGACSLAQAPGSQPPPAASAGLDCHSSCYDAWEGSQRALSCCMKNSSMRLSTASISQAIL